MFKQRSSNIVWLASLRRKNSHCTRLLLSMVSCSKRFTGLRLAQIKGSLLWVRSPLLPESRWIWIPSGT